VEGAGAGSATEIASVRSALLSTLAGGVIYKE